jgi:hypothetical protein
MANRKFATYRRKRHVTSDETRCGCIAKIVKANIAEVGLLPSRHKGAFEIVLNAADPKLPLA